MVEINLSNASSEKIIFNLSSLSNTTKEITITKEKAVIFSGIELAAGFDLTGNLQAALSSHDKNASAHEPILTELAKKANLLNVNEDLALKADTETTYTKTETDAALSSKLNVSDSTVTKQGNSFNGSNQLVQLDTTGALPTIDGSRLTGIPNCVRFATCPTASATSEKIISLSNVNLVAGLTLLVTFTNANTSDTPKINFDGTVKNLIFKDGISVDATHPYKPRSGEKDLIIFNGTDWIIQRRATYDSGLFSVTTNQTYTKTHGLGTSKIKYIVLIADDASGTNQRPAADWYNGDYYSACWTASTITDTTLTFKTAVNHVGISISQLGMSSAYYRILAEGI